MLYSYLTLNVLIFTLVTYTGLFLTKLIGDTFLLYSVDLGYINSVYLT